MNLPLIYNLVPPEECAACGKMADLNDDNLCQLCSRPSVPYATAHMALTPGGRKATRGPVPLSLWIANQIFHKKEIGKLLSEKDEHKAVAKSTKRGGEKKVNLIELLEAAKEGLQNTKKMGALGSLVNMDKSQPRDRLRWDISLSDAWVEQMKAKNKAFGDACELADLVKRMDLRCKNAVVDWHAQLVLPDSQKQSLHVDDDEAQCYYTMLIPLTSNPRSGGTYFPELGRVFAEVGSAIVFSGRVSHAGLGNQSDSNRIFLYAAISKDDSNV